MATILIVDDDSMVCEMLGTFVRVLGHEPCEVGTGSEARAAALDRLPDVILLDIMLPDFSGLDLCRELRGTSATRDVPIIIISARTPPSTEEAFAAGASAYLTKPVGLASLRATLASAGVEAARA